MRLGKYVIVLCGGIVLLACATANSYRKGVEYDRAGQHERAVREFTKAIAWDPDQPAPLHGRGLAYIDLGEYESAINDFDEAIRLDPDYYLAYYTRGTLYASELQDYQRAVRDLDRCIELNSQFAPAYQNRGVAHEAMGNHQQACQDWRRACELDFSLGCASVEEEC